MDIQKSAGIKGKKSQERIELDRINDDFVVDFPLSTAQKKAIEVIYSMRAVKMSQLVDILGYNYQYTAKQMLQLYLNRFVDRIFPPKDINQPGTNESYFLLDQAGAIFISGYYEIPLKNVNWNRRDNLIKFEKLRHTFEISGVRAQIEKYARKKEHKIINCLADRHLYMDFKFEDKKYILRPDMYFQYIDKKKQYNYFVEVDLGTMAVTANSIKTEAFENKTDYYEAYKLSGEYKKNYNVFPRVLVITTTIERAEKLCEAVKARQKTNVEFLFTSFFLWNEYCTGPIFINTNGDKTTMFE